MGVEPEPEPEPQPEMEPTNEQQPTTTLLPQEQVLRATAIHCHPPIQFTAARAPVQLTAGAPIQITACAGPARVQRRCPRSALRRMSMAKRTGKKVSASLGLSTQHSTARLRVP